MSILGKVFNFFDRQEDSQSNLYNSGVTDFISYFSRAGDMSRSDFFNVIIEVPPNISKQVGLSGHDLMYQCEAAELPGRHIDLMPIRHNTFLDRIPMDINYPEVNLTFICRSDLLEKKLFDVWMEKMVGTQEDRNYGLVRYKIQSNDETDRYDCSIRIFQKFQIPTTTNASTIRLVEAMPTQVSSMPLHWNDQNFHKLTVTFAYRKWVAETIKWSDVSFIGSSYDEAVQNAQESGFGGGGLLDTVKTIVDVTRFVDVYSRRGDTSKNGIIQNVIDIFD
jgi:hypothetical protein